MSTIEKQDVDVAQIQALRGRVVSGHAQHVETRHDGGVGRVHGVRGGGDGADQGVVEEERDLEDPGIGREEVNAEVDVAGGEAAKIDDGTAVVEAGHCVERVNQPPVESEGRGGEGGEGEEEGEGEREDQDQPHG